MYLKCTVQEREKTKKKKKDKCRKRTIGCDGKKTTALPSCGTGRLNVMIIVGRRLSVLLLCA